MVLLFGPIIALSTAGEPPLDATASEGARFGLPVTEMILSRDGSVLSVTTG